MIRFVYWLFLGMCLPLLWGACNPTPPAPPPVVSCQDNSECAGNQTCKSGVCTRIVATSDGGDRKEASAGDQDGCEEGAVQPCHTVKEEQRNKGICKDGQQTCTDGKWGPCIGEIPPTKGDACDGLDNNCDGQTDEGCDCKPDDTQPCGSSLGACKLGTQTCEGNGKWGPCAGGSGRVDETCDGKDNDCDGEVDEDFKVGQSCVAGEGACQQTGTIRCDKATGKGRCDVPARTPQPETCNGIDDDCDGQTDETFANQGKPCQIPGKQGPCAAGAFACKSGQEVCEPSQVPGGTKESCDGKDNDCDGLTDEDFPKKGQACLAGKGACQVTGTFICAPDGKSLICDKQPVAPTAKDDSVCDGKDEDCDGSIDEDCACTTGTKRPCFSGSSGCSQAAGAWTCLGTCKAGEQLCANGRWGACSGEKQPASELCDGLDNDCDGKVDNGNPGSGQACTVGKRGECDKGKTVCRNGKVACESRFQASPELCDGKDNDCDGQTDEGNPGAGNNCNSGKPGICAAGLTVCGNGVLSCAPKNAGSKEKCDGKDNDCNGKVDDGNPGGGTKCKANAQGLCAEGLTRCEQGKVVCAPGAKKSEICNQIDDDCDGKTDNGLGCRKGEGKCGGIGGQQKFTCRSDCSGFQGGSYCEVLRREYCFRGTCRKCTACRYNNRKCSGDKKSLIVCTFDANGKCGEQSRPCAKGCHQPFLQSPQCRK